MDVVEWSRALQCINGVGSNPGRGKNKNLTALKSNSNTVWFNFQTHIYIYIKYICTIYTRLYTCLTCIPRFALREKVTLRLLKLLF